MAQRVTRSTVILINSLLFFGLMNTGISWLPVSRSQGGFCARISRMLATISAEWAPPMDGTGGESSSAGASRNFFKCFNALFFYLDNVVRW